MNRVDVSPRLRAYLGCEREYRSLVDAGDDEASDWLLNALDPLWLGLSAEERAWLDQRPDMPPQGNE